MRSQALSYHEMQMSVGIATLNKLRILNNLLAQKWPPVVSDSALYTELNL